MMDSRAEAVPLTHTGLRSWVAHLCTSFSEQRGRQTSWLDSVWGSRPWQLRCASGMYLLQGDTLPLHVSTFPDRTDTPESYSHMRHTPHNEHTAALRTGEWPQFFTGRHSLFHETPVLTCSRPWGQGGCPDQCQQECPTFPFIQIFP